MKIFRRLPCLSAILLAVALTAAGQTPGKPAVPVLMLSDVHFDPFHDPAKFSQLQASPVAGWAAILDSAASPAQPAEFAQLQTTCAAKGIDTSMQLLEDSLRAERTRQPAPLFITISGDLMAHRFDCRFQTLASRLPGNRVSAADLSAFAAKTVTFVALELRQAFPNTPIYFALGNNDSGCGDYREDPGSAFLRAVAESFAADAIDPANRAAILNEFPQLGDYSVVLPAPMHHARLIVLQDIFESKRYAPCHGAESSAAAHEQIAWLRMQLIAARAAHEHVWVMAHIPPGIDVYSTLTKSTDVCGSGGPALFLNNEALADTLAEFPDVIRLALFAHTHMDEMRLLKSSSGEAIPAKLVPSISPVDGNNPAFTAAEVDPRTATLQDYAVYVANNQTGVDTRWNAEYRYSAAYGQPDFSSESLSRLTSDFAADKDGSTASSRDYQRFYFAGRPDDSNAVKAQLMMRLLWPIDVCSITHVRSAGFRACVCPATPAAPPAHPRAPTS